MSLWDCPQMAKMLSTSTPQQLGLSDSGVRSGKPPTKTFRPLRTAYGCSDVLLGLPHYSMYIYILYVLYRYNTIHYTTIQYNILRHITSHYIITMYKYDFIM